MNDYDITPLRVLAVLAVYAVLLGLIWLLFRPRIERYELRTALAIAAVWAVSVFIANYLLYRAGAMSYLPWVNNFMHTFI
ncbi:MAG TPA: hypothetical protein VHH91_08245, partial [Vicinamibacterales bacterium]|nr:hypothetical protein [Vicinamibacterales bacterium]